MDKYYQILDIWSLEEFLNDQDIDHVDVLAALDQAGLVDIDDILIRYKYYDEDEEAFD